MGVARLYALLTRICLFALAVAGVSGCQSLLPAASDATQVGWRSFDEARAAVEAIEPFETHKSTLMANGFDPLRNPAVTILTYPEIVQRFAAGSALQPDEYEPGIRSCLRAGASCSGYAIVAKRIKRDRIGSFWLDSLAFRREVDVTGWTFTGLILFVDDLAVYRVFGGQPNLHERQITRNPLGPIQGWGDALRPRF
ncbi:MAG: hypothetical protein EHM83_05230 [Burkholderiales bacterium]|nr:MAG: hypothetical protein EHM83_05230 [Burkholderiales bacterium]